MTDNRFKDFPYDARFPSPGVDVRFDTPGLDRRFMDGLDTRFEGSDYGGTPVIAGVPSFAGLNFTRGVVRSWGGLDFGAGFSRGSAGTFIDAEGNIQRAGVNTARVQSVGGGRFGLLMEAGRTNRLLNSAVVATQSFSTTGLQTTLSFYGTGSVTLSGTATGTLVGTGANNRVSLTFFPTTGTLTITPSGDVRLGQLETDFSATSYIATGATPVARSPDIANIALSASAQTAMANGYWAVVQGAVMGGIVRSLDCIYQFDTGDLNDRQAINYIFASAAMAASMVVGGVSQIANVQTPYTLGAKINIATKFAENDFAQIWNNGTVQVDTSCAFILPNRLLLAASGSSTSSKPSSLLIERIELFPPTISVADMAAYRSSLP